MGNIINDPEVFRKWQEMPVELQISNIGSEVLRADRWKKRGNVNNMRSFYNAAVDFLRLSIRDPKNRARVGEFNLLIDELADYFIGTNKWGTSSETLEKYYNEFL